MKKLIASVLFIMTLCAASGVFAEEDSLPVFANFGEAEAASVPCQSQYGEYSRTVAEIDGRLYVVTAEADEKAMELIKADIQEMDKYKDGPRDDYVAAYKALEEYIGTLPVTAVREITDVPMTREEMDALVGKSFREVKENPEGVHDILIPGTAEEGREVIFQLYRGSYIYDVVINEPYETYKKLEGSWVDDSRTIWQDGDYDSLTIKSVRYRFPNAY